MLITNGTLVVLSPPHVEKSNLRIADGAVVECAVSLHPDVGEETIDLSGKYILPGMVNAHTHLYSSLARGMAAPRTRTRSFVEILKRVWWKLDQALDDEAIYYGALVGSIDAAKFGTTTLVDHHSSPDCIRGSLDLIRKAMRIAGLRGILCYETTDRGGKGRRNAGLEENERFVSASASDPSFRGSIGAHASFTLNDDTLREIGNLSQTYDCGVHVHVAEDSADVVDAKKNRGMSLTARLSKYGILSRKSILAHCVHLSKSQLDAVGRSGAWLAHNPRSNMNNDVGYAPLQWFGRETALGTDGFPSNMFEECKLGFFRNQESRHKVAFARLSEMLHGGQRLVSGFFGRDFGSFKPGSPADVIVLDYNPPTPLNSENLPSHFLFGMNSGMVVHTMIGGEWRMWNRELVGIDEPTIFAEAEKVARRLWGRMEKKR